MDGMDGLGWDGMDGLGWVGMGWDGWDGMVGEVGFYWVFRGKGGKHFQDLELRLNCRYELSIVTPGIKKFYD